MPSSITALMVDLNELRRVFGSKNKGLLKAILDENDIDDEDTDTDDFEEADEGDEDIDLDELDGLPSSRDALWHIIMGEPWARGIGSKYANMFRYICEHLGERLEADHWCETRAEFVAAFDGVLSRVGISPTVVRMEALTGSPDIFPLPPRSDAPFMGSLTTTKAAEAAKVMAAVDSEALAQASQRIQISRGVVESEFVVACFRELQAWCETCVEQKKDLLLFYS